MAEYELIDFIDEEHVDERTILELIEEDERTRDDVLDDAINSKGKEIFFDLKSLYGTLNMVNKNYHILCKKRNEFIHRGSKYWMKNDMDEFFREYLRLLHNYSASVHTLIARTYTFLDRYDPDAEGFKEGYSEELGSRGLGDKVNLLKQIRHYTQKYWEPPIYASLTFENEDFEEPGLYLKREEMLEWDGWNSDAKSFLREFEDDIPMKTIAVDYQREINDFFDWFRVYTLGTFYEEVLEFITADLSLSQDEE